MLPTALVLLIAGCATGMGEDVATMRDPGDRDPMEAETRPLPEEELPPEELPPDEPPPEEPPPAASRPRRPVLFIHGINGSSADFATMADRLVRDGVDPTRLWLIDFPDPSWGCNRDNAAVIGEAVAQILAETGASEIDLVAHSMGSLSSRHYAKFLAAPGTIHAYVSLGGMHQGLWAPCLSPLDVCVWQELCESGDFITALNTAPATPTGPRWVSIAGSTDETVEVSRTHLEGAENVVVEDADHVGLLTSEAAYAVVREALEVAPLPATR